MKSISHLSPEDQENYMLCPHCKEYISLHNLANAASHIKGKCAHASKQIVVLEYNIDRYVEILGNKYQVDLN